MAFDVNRDGARLVVSVDGRLDAQAAPSLSDAMKEALDGVAEIVFDLEGLEYISSAGLRVLLASYKLMVKREGAMKVQNARDDVMNVLDMSGFASLFGCTR